jgi:hypothetical protein
MQQDFGSFIEPTDGCECLTIHFSPTSLPLQQRWHHHGLSTDFVAEYWATFFPASAPLSQDRQLEIKGAIAYIANELLENIFKFSHKTAAYTVDLKLCLFEDEFRFYSSNAIAPQAVEAFQTRIQKLLSGDPQELYIRQVELNAQSESKSGSQLGLLTLLNDYQAQLAWRFESKPQQPDVVVVTTMVQVDLFT